MTEMSGGPKVHRARKTPTIVYSTSPPALSAGIDAAYHALDRSLLEQFEEAWKDRIVTSQILYKPGILAAARTNIQGTRWNLHHERDITKIVSFPPKHQMCLWEENLNAGWNFHDSRTDPEPSSFFVSDAAYDFSPEHFEELREDFIQHLSSTETLTVEYNPYFKLDRKMDESAESFSTRCMDKAREDFNQEMHQMEDTLQRLQDRLIQKLDREAREIGADASTMNFKRRSGEMDVQEEIDAHDSMTNMEDIKKEMNVLSNLREIKMKEFEENLVRIAKERETEMFRMNRSQIHLLQFGLIWLPYMEYVIQEEDSRRLDLVQSF